MQVGVLTEAESVRLSTGSELARESRTTRGGGHGDQADSKPAGQSSILCRPAYSQCLNSLSQELMKRRLVLLAVLSALVVSLVGASGASAHGWVYPWAPGGPPAFTGYTSTGYDSGGSCTWDTSGNWGYDAGRGVYYQYVGHYVHDAGNGRLFWQQNTSGVGGYYVWRYCG